MRGSLETLRLAGWSVAVHNDYRQGGRFHTFWLLTHPCGRWVKGEGSSDLEALQQCADAAHQALEDREALAIAVLQVLHSNLPEAERPMSRSDLSDAQWERLQAAIDVVLGWPVYCRRGAG